MLRMENVSKAYTHRGRLVKALDGATLHIPGGDFVSVVGPSGSGKSTLLLMLGGMLSGHDECEGEIRYEERDGKKVPVGMTFYGMSSEAAMKKYSGGVAHYRAAEGKVVETPYRGPVDNTIGEIMGGVRSMMTYIGATQLKEVTKRTSFVRVTAQTNDVFGRS